MNSYVFSAQSAHTERHVLEVVFRPSIFRITKYRDADKSLTQPTSRCILFDGENISLDASLYIYIYIYTQIVLIFLQLWL